MTKEEDTGGERLPVLPLEVFPCQVNGTTTSGMGRRESETQVQRWECSYRYHRFFVMNFHYLQLW